MKAKSSPNNTRDAILGLIVISAGFLFFDYVTEMENPTGIFKVLQFVFMAVMGIVVTVLFGMMVFGYAGATVTLTYNWAKRKLEKKISEEVEKRLTEIEKQKRHGE